MYKRDLTHITFFILEVKIIGFDKNEIPKDELQFFRDLAIQTKKGIGFYARFSSIMVSNGHIIDLGLQSCKLNKITDTIGILSKLINLDLNNNFHIKLPKTIGNLTQLEGIIFDITYGVTLPSSFYKLKNNRSVDHNNSLAITFNRSSFQAVGELFRYCEALHYDQHYEGIFHPNSKVFETSLAKYMTKVKFYKSI